jgi:hypothetical protein
LGTKTWDEGSSVCDFGKTGESSGSACEFDTSETQSSDFVKKAGFFEQRQRTNYIRIRVIIIVASGVLERNVAIETKRDGLFIDKRAIQVDRRKIDFDIRFRLLVFFLAFLGRRLILRLTPRRGIKTPF